MSAPLALSREPLRSCSERRVLLHEPRRQNDFVGGESPRNPSFGADSRDDAPQNVKYELDVLWSSLRLRLVNPDELKTLAEVRGYAGANRVTLSFHANRRLRQRGGGPADAVHALTNAVSCADQRADPGRTGDWRIMGPDTDGDDLTCAVILADGVVVVTVF